MQTAMTVNTDKSPRARSAKNLKYANDGSYESVKAQLHKLAFMCYSRAAKLGLGMDYDDVLQTMNVSYCKAKAKWKPEGGARFSTYCQTVCLNNFNQSIEREIKDIKSLGLVSYGAVFGSEGFDDEEPPFGNLEPSVEDNIVLSDEIRERMDSLSAGARKLITAMLMAERDQNISNPPRLRELARLCGLEGDELRQVKVEILNKFGVRWL